MSVKEQLLLPPPPQVSEKEQLLEEADAVWVELRHEFIADVYTTLSNKLKEFQSKNKAARAASGARVPACI